MSEQLRHDIRWTPGHDCIQFECKWDRPACRPGEGGSHGRHGLTIRFLAIGQHGAVQFVLYTGLCPALASTMCDAAKQTNGIERRIGHDEELITLTAATGHLPKVDGKKVAVCTLWRWCRRGLRGVFLEYVRVGRKICTTRQALLRFFTDLAEIDKRIEPDRYAKPTHLNRTPITSRQRQKDANEWHTIDAHPMPADLAYHSKTPRYDGQEPVTDDCEYTEGSCYYDGSSLNAWQPYAALVNAGIDALWAFLDTYYEHVFGDADFPTPAAYPKPLRALMEKP